MNDLKPHQQDTVSRTLTVAVTGSSGLIGKALSSFLESGGHTVLRLRHGQPGEHGALSWDSATGVTDPTRLDGIDAVIHLAGDSIAAGRWTRDRKRAIHDSRSMGTKVLAETLAKLSTPPKALLCASAIGFYGDRGAEVVDESSASGRGFLADVCRDWETATASARDADIRVVNMRIGIVLAAKGGALQKMLSPFRMGVGGVIGSGKQYMSWIALDDIIGAIHHLLFVEHVAGPVNLVAPNAVTNREFTKTLGRVLKRPTVVPMPAFAVRLAFGEMGQELLLDGAHVKPTKLLESGFTFLTPELEPALRSELGLHQT